MLYWGVKFHEEEGDKVERGSQIRKWVLKLTTVGGKGS